MSIITHRPNNISQLDQSLPLIFFSFFYLFSNSQSTVVAQNRKVSVAFLNYTQYAEHMKICAHVENYFWVCIFCPLWCHLGFEKCKTKASPRWLTGIPCKQTSNRDLFWAYLLGQKCSKILRGKKTFLKKLERYLEILLRGMEEAWKREKGRERERQGRGFI